MNDQCHDQLVMASIYIYIYIYIYISKILIKLIFNQDLKEIIKIKLKELYTRLFVVVLHVYCSIQFVPLQITQLSPYPK